MEAFGEDLLALIFRRVDASDDRKSISLVCKQWLKVEGVTRSTLHALDPQRLPNFLSRFPNLLNFRTSAEIPSSAIQFVVDTCPRIQVLDLSCDKGAGEGFMYGDFDNEGLRYIAEGLPVLETLLLRGRLGIGDVGVSSIDEFSKKLRVLDLGYCLEYPSTLFVDVLSVKEHPRQLMLTVLPQDSDLLCTHPIFGPDIGKHGWKDLTFMFEKVRIRDEPTCNRFLQIFSSEGCRMLEMTCEEHERLSARSQFLTHTIGRVLSEVGAKPTPIDTKGFQKLVEVKDSTTRDGFYLFSGLLIHYRFAQEGKGEGRTEVTEGGDDETMSICSGLS